MSGRVSPVKELVRRSSPGRAGGSAAYALFRGYKFERTVVPVGWRWSDSAGAASQAEVNPG